VKVTVKIKDIFDMEHGWSDSHLFLEWLRNLNENMEGFVSYGFVSSLSISG